MLTTQQFAAAMKVDYRTALNWLNARIVPGAVKREFPGGHYWEIPTSALGMERPKRGRRKEN